MPGRLAPHGLGYCPTEVAAADGRESAPRPYRTDQSTVVRPVLGVPKGLTPFDTIGQDVELPPGAGGGIGGSEIIGLDRDEVLVVATLQNGFKHVPHELIHSCKKQVLGRRKNARIADKEAAAGTLT